MRTAEFTFELPCNDLVQRAQIEQRLLYLLDRDGLNVQSNWASDINCEVPDGICNDSKLNKAV